jgi:hypothetical protein
MRFTKKDDFGKHEPVDVIDIDLKIDEFASVKIVSPFGEKQFDSPHEPNELNYHFKNAEYELNLVIDRSTRRFLYVTIKAAHGRIGCGVNALSTCETSNERDQCRLCECTRLTEEGNKMNIRACYAESRDKNSLMLLFHLN